jgi:hypothetical protein
VVVEPSRNGGAEGGDHTDLSTARRLPVRTVRTDHAALSAAGDEGAQSSCRSLWRQEPKTGIRSQSHWEQESLVRSKSVVGCH